jgi:hypothetical protein
MGRPPISLSVAAALPAAVPLVAQCPTTPPPTVEPAPGCPGVVNLSWHVAGIPRVNRVLWELKRDSDLSWVLTGTAVRVN